MLLVLLETSFYSNHIVGVSSFRFVTSRQWGVWDEWWVRVCLFDCLLVCVRDQSLNWKRANLNFTKFLVHVAYGRGRSVLLCRFFFAICYVLPVFLDDIMFSHNGPMVRHAYSKLVIEHDKHSSLNSHQILLSDKDQQVLIISCTLGWGMLSIISFFTGAICVDKLDIIYMCLELFSVFSCMVYSYKTLVSIHYWDTPLKYYISETVPFCPYCLIPLVI